MMKIGKELQKAKWNLWQKRWIVFLVVFSMIFGDIHPIFAVGEQNHLSIHAKITPKDTQDSGVVKISEDRYLLTNGAEIALEVKISVNDLEKNGRLQGLYTGLSLGYISDKNDGGLDTTDQGLGRLEARVINDGNNWKDKEVYQVTGKLTDAGKVFHDEVKLYFKANDFTYDDMDLVYSYVVNVRFDTLAKENAVIDLKSFVGYEEHIVDEQVADRDYDSRGSVDNSSISLVNSSLEWESKLTALSGAMNDETAPTIWKKYNYQDMIGEMSNVSKAKESYMDGFELLFFLPYHAGYVKDEDLVTWIYNPLC